MSSHLKFRLLSMNAGYLGFLVSFILVLLLPVRAYGAEAQTVAFVSSFGVDFNDGPQAIVYINGSIFVGYEEGSNGGSSTLEEYDTAGNRQNIYGVALSRLKGMSLLANNNLLLTETTTGAPTTVGFYEYDPTTGNPVTSGPTGGFLDISPPSSDPKGVVFDGTYYYVTDESSDTLYKLDGNGDVILSIASSSIEGGLSDVEGVAYDPSTDHVFIVSDSSDKLYELDTSFNLIGTTDLDAMLSGVSGFDSDTDAEGLTIDNVNRVLYIAFNDDERVGVFSLSGSYRSRITFRSF